MKSSFCIDLQRFMLIPTKFPLTHKDTKKQHRKRNLNHERIKDRKCKNRGFIGKYRITGEKEMYNCW